MHEITPRLTLKQIHLLVPVDKRDGKYQCPLCHLWHLCVDQNTLDFSCKTPECAGRANEIAALIWREVQRRESKPKQSDSPPSGRLVIVEYAMPKQLPSKWLSDHFGATEGKHPYYKQLECAVCFPYFDEHGKEITQQWRWGMGGKDRRYLKGKPTYLYAGHFLEYLELMAEKGDGPAEIFICEGESNTQTLWLNNLPALGLPGVGNWQEEWAKLKCLQQAKVLYFLLDMKDGEPEAAALLGARKVAESFPPGKVRIVRLPTKDVSDLWIFHTTDGFGRGQKGFLEELKEAVLEATSVIHRIKVLHSNKSASLPTFDMPESVLAGRLGELLTNNLAKLPRAYAWLSLVAVAGILVPPSDESTSLYVANVGPSGSGKGVAIEHSLKLLGLQIGEPEVKPLVFTDQAGSFEGLARHSLGDRNGEQCIWYQPELSITLGKSKIEGATFSPALCDLYDHHRFAVVIKKERVAVAARMTIAGGLVDGNFADVFSGVTSYGLYQRFLFGLHQETGWLDHEYTGQLIKRPELAPVTVGGSAREAIRSFGQKHADVDQVGRILQNVLRAAVICAAWDGKAELTGDDMAPHLALADYQIKVRLVLRPDPGRNQQAQVGNRIMAYLQRHDGDALVRKIDGDCNISKQFGSGMRDQVIRQLSAAGEIEIVSQRPFVIRFKQS